MATVSPGGLVLIRSKVELTAPNPDRRLAIHDEYSTDLNPMSYLEVFHKKREASQRRTDGCDGGVGVDFRTSSPNVRIRVQFDIRHIFDSVSGFNAERLSAGVVLPLNK